MCGVSVCTGREAVRAPARRSRRTWRQPRPCIGSGVSQSERACAVPTSAEVECCRGSGARASARIDVLQAPVRAPRPHVTAVAGAAELASERRQARLRSGPPDRCGRGCVEVLSSPESVFGWGCGRFRRVRCVGCKGVAGRRGARAVSRSADEGAAAFPWGGVGAWRGPGGVPVRWLPRLLGAVSVGCGTVFAAGG